LVLTKVTPAYAHPAKPTITNITPNSNPLHNPLNPLNPTKPTIRPRPDFNHNTLICASNPIGTESYC
jgi:hypothetical protein